MQRRGGAGLAPALVLALGAGCGIDGGDVTAGTQRPMVDDPNGVSHAGGATSGHKGEPREDASMTEGGNERAGASAPEIGTGDAGPGVSDGNPRGGLGAGDAEPNTDERDSGVHPTGRDMGAHPRHGGRVDPLDGVQISWMGYLQGRLGAHGPLALLPAGGLATYGNVDAGAVVLRYGVPGELVWWAPLPTPLPQPEPAIPRSSFFRIATGEQRIYLAGTSNGAFAGQPENPSGITTATLAALDTQGEPLWARQLTPLQSTDVLLAVDHDGNAYLSGSPRGGFQQAVDITVPAAPILGPPCFFVAKYSPDGQQQWLRRWSGGCSAGLWSSVVDWQGATYALTRGVRGGNPTMDMVKISSDGALVWSRAWPVEVVPTDIRMAVSPDGAQVYVGGTSYLEWSQAERPRIDDRQRPFLAAFAADGDYLWGHTLRMNGLQMNCRSRQDCLGIRRLRLAASNDGVFLLGDTVGFIDGASNPGARSQVVILAFGVDGHKTWARQVAAESPREVDRTASAVDIAVDPAGRPWVLGMPNGTIGPQREEGSINWFMGHFDPQTGSLL